MWFDTHAHLDAAEFDGDRDAVIARAAAVGVSRLLVPAVEVANLDAVDALCLGARPGTGIECLPGWGIHPMYTPRAVEADLEAIRRRILARRPAAVGEIGLDGYVPGLDMTRQEPFFAAQLRFAAEFDLPVVLHIRRAQDLVLKHLRRFRNHFVARGPGRAGIAHAFNGSRQQAEAFIELGFCLGFGGAMTYTGSTRIRALATELPMETLVLETDAPDIAPAWLGGGRNEPAELPRIGALLAELRGTTPEAVAARTTTNALRIFADA
jgi:TatD DNase family protein